MNSTVTRITYGNEPDQFGDLRVPAGPGPHPVVMVLHGGRWQASVTLGGISPACASLAEQGVAVWNVEYRRLGIEGGGWPGTWQDVAAAADALRSFAAEHRLDPSRVVVLGHSAGGPLALWLAGRHRLPSTNALFRENPLALRGAISMAGVNDLRTAWARNMGEGVLNELLGGGPQAFPERYASTSPPDLLPFGIPQLLVHGTADTMVDVSVSQDYARAAQSRGDDARVVLLDGADHFQIRDPATSAWPRVRDAVTEFCREVTGVEVATT